VKLNLERADYSAGQIKVIYSTRGSGTHVSLLALNLIIFDGYNPAFRFAEGVISQSYLDSQVEISIPPQGVSELRTYMIGINSFEINTDTLISISASMSNKFALNIGPTTSNCKVNFITVSYLVLSVFSECGACHPYLISYNGGCVASCPIGHYVKDGKCEPKTCKSGFYLLNGDCTKCPRHSDIKECNNACESGFKLRDEDCIPVCRDPN